MKTLKEILPYYLNTGLKCQNLFGESSELLGLTDKNWLFKHHNQLLEGYLYQCKPHLRTLDSLTKPITVEGYNDGKPFVPIDMLFNSFGIKIDEDNEMYLDYYEIGETDSPFTGFGVVQLLLKWHVNVFNLPTDQFIEIKD